MLAATEQEQHQPLDPPLARDVADAVRRPPRPGVRKRHSRPPTRSRPPSCGAKPASVRDSSSRPEPMTPAMPEDLAGVELEARRRGRRRRGRGRRPRPATSSRNGRLQRLAVVFGLQAAADHQLVQLGDVGLGGRQVGDHRAVLHHVDAVARARAPRRAGARRRRSAARALSARTRANRISISARSSTEVGSSSRMTRWPAACSSSVSALASSTIWRVAKSRSAVGVRGSTSTLDLGELARAPPRRARAS